MADTPAVGGGAINVPTTSTGTPSTLSPIEMARRAMRPLGSQTDKEILRAALELVQDCINDINIRSKFNFTVANDTDITLVEDQREYDIPAAAFGLKELVLVKQNTTPEEILPLGWIQWDQLQRFFQQEGSGHPYYWTSRDPFVYRKVELARAPDASAAANYKLRIYYQKAVDNPPVNDSSLSIEAPAVLSTCIQRYVSSHLLGIYGDPNDPRRRDYYREYRDLLNNLRGMENRATPGTPQMRLVGFVQGQTGINSRYRHGPWRT